MSLDIGVTGYLELSEQRYDLTIIYNSNNYLEGTCDFGNNELTVAFGAQNDSANIVGRLKGKDGTSIRFNLDFIKKISNAFENLLPEEFEIVLDNVLFAMNDQNEDTNALFSLKVDAAIDLSNLPLVGEAIPGGQGVAVENFQVLISTGEIDSTELNKMISDDSLKLPKTIVKGANFSIDMLLGEERKTVEVAL